MEIENVTDFYDRNGTDPYVLHNRTFAYEPRPFTDMDIVRIILYAIIFILSVCGNTLVILTLVQNKRMRTVTNVFLLNLTISDLLLCIFCMPITLVGALLQNWIFRAAMCTLIMYFQAVSVAVSAFTLVAISLERYCAICYPLRSRSWRTMSHSYKVIAIVWLLALTITFPIAVVMKQIRWGPNRYKCREVWPSVTAERAFSLFIDVILFILPLLLMLIAYTLISRTLWRRIKLEEEDFLAEAQRRADTVTHARADGTGGATTEILNGNSFNSPATKTVSSSSNSSVGVRHEMRKYGVNTKKNLTAKKRLIKMLFVVVLEFFVCWAPLYVVYTVLIFTPPERARDLISETSYQLILLLAYTSSCTNPITYCFMNKKFRQAFIQVFSCSQKSSSGRLTTLERQTCATVLHQVTGSSVTDRSTQKPQETSHTSGSTGHNEKGVEETDYV